MSRSTRSTSRKAAVYYNENDPQIAAWLRELRAEGLIPDGAIDERSIEEVAPSDCAPTSHHFAGIAGWPYALRLAGWPADAPVWTGSCPCPPFSSAGRKKCPKCENKGLGFFAGPLSVIEEFGCGACGWRDRRNLWPQFFRLIKACQPPVVFGEQTNSLLGREWLAGVRADMAKVGYVVPAADLCAAGVGAPQRRQRLWFVADANGEGQPLGKNARTISKKALDESARQAPIGGRQTGKLANAQGAKAGAKNDLRKRQPHAGTGRSMGDADRKRLSSGRKAAATARHGRPALADGGHGFWTEFELASFSDGQHRRIEPGTLPLAPRLPSTMVKLRGYGNSIAPQLAAVFVRAYMEARGLV